MIDFSYSLAGALTGLVVGLTGVGGGALMTPILLLSFGVTPTTAIATDLWFSAITKVFGVLVHRRAGNLDWQVLRRLWAGSLPLAVGVVLLVTLYAPVGRVSWLTKVVGALVLVTALGMLMAPMLRQFAQCRRIDHAERFRVLQGPLTVLAGAFLGLCVALTSVGAGALGSVLLLYLYPLRMQPRRLVATDLVHAIPLAVVAGLGYLFAGKVDGWMLLSMLIGSVPMVLVGSLLAGRMRERWLQLAVALVLCAVGIQCLL